MALTVGTNSYIDYAGADDYMANRLYVSAWDGAGQQTCEKALMMATRRIDGLILSGRKAVNTQPLQFPRVYDGRCALTSEVPQSVMDAVCEEALAILASGENGDARQKLQAAGVQGFSMGSLSETFKTGGACELQSPEAARLMSAFMGVVEID